MKFRTEIEIAPLTQRIGYRHHLLAVGSCFAEHIAGKLANLDFFRRKKAFEESRFSPLLREIETPASQSDKRDRTK